VLLALRTGAASQPWAAAWSRLSRARLKVLLHCTAHHSPAPHHASPLTPSLSPVVVARRCVDAANLALDKCCSAAVGVLPALLHEGPVGARAPCGIALKAGEPPCKAGRQRQAGGARGRTDLPQVPAPAGGRWAGTSQLKKGWCSVSWSCTPAPPGLIRLCTFSPCAAHACVGTNQPVLPEAA